MHSKQSFVRFRQKLVLILFCVLILCIFMRTFANKKPIDNKISCFKDLSSISKIFSSISYFEDILDAEKQPTAGKAIFFHETSCNPNGIAKLNAKQACAIESAARWNPDRDIFIIFASPVGVKDYRNLPPFIEHLWKYDNIHFRNMDLWRYSMDTPVEQWINSNKLFDSKYLYEHMSDYLRAVTLFKFGGFYMDLDVVVQKNLDDLGEDFVVDDWHTVVATSIIHLNNYGIGREVSKRYLEKMQINFDGSVFIANGPTILTEICADICKSNNRMKWTRARCAGLDLKPKANFHPIAWRNYIMYFDRRISKEALKLTENATLIHVWNDRSSEIWNKIGTDNVYQMIASKNCPFVYESSEYF